jgi:hypothetical protein
MRETEILVSALVVLGILIVIFLICRELICWYYKINSRQEYLKIIANQLTATFKCKFCGLTTKVNTHFCPGCDKDGLGLTKEDYKAKLNQPPPVQ